MKKEREQSLLDLIPTYEKKIHRPSTYKDRIPLNKLLEEWSSKSGIDIKILKSELRAETKALRIDYMTFPQVKVACKWVQGKIDDLQEIAPEQLVETEQGKSVMASEHKEANPMPQKYVLPLYMTTTSYLDVVDSLDLYFSQNKAHGMCWHYLSISGEHDLYRERSRDVWLCIFVNPYFRSIQNTWIQVAPERISRGIGVVVGSEFRIYGDKAMGFIDEAKNYLEKYEKSFKYKILSWLNRR